MATRRISLSAARSPDTDRAEIKLRTSAGPAGLGGPYFYVALLGLRTYKPLKIHQQVQKGLAYAVFERFRRNTALTLPELGALVQLPARTIARRKADGRLAPDESDRLLRAARVFGRALDLFEGEANDARDWLRTPQMLLGGLVPLDLARTDVGALEVERLIGRLEHGIPS